MGSKHAVNTKQTEAKRHKTLSRAVAKTWKNQEVAELRSARDGVMVAWKGQAQEFKSVRQAFVALGLPMEKHIKFRAIVKLMGRGIFEYEEETYKFFISDPKEGAQQH